MLEKGTLFTRGGNQNTALRFSFTATHSRTNDFPLIMNFERIQSMPLAIYEVDLTHLIVSWRH